MLQVLRSVLAAHPFNLDKVVSKGIGLKLTKSTIQVRPVVNVLVHLSIR